MNNYDYIYKYIVLPIKFIHISLIKETFTRQLSITLIQFVKQGNSFCPAHKLQYESCINESIQ